MDLQQWLEEAAQRIEELEELMRKELEPEQSGQYIDLAAEVRHAILGAQNKLS